MILKKNTIIFGNLPYNISSQILVKILKLQKWPPNISDIIFMFQKELGEKIIGKFLTKNYGRLSIISKFRLKMVKNFLVSPNSFFPKPNFYTKDLSIIEKNNDIAKVKNFKIFISTNRLFEMNYLFIKDVQFVKADFNINFDDLHFFKKLLFINPNNYSLSILKSNFSL